MADIVSRERERIRKRLLSILSRNQLEELSGLERPWAADRSSLLKYALARWHGEEVEEAVRVLIRRAAEEKSP